jgi:hypothetical protein
MGIPVGAASSRDKPSNSKRLFTAGSRSHNLIFSRVFMTLRQKAYTEDREVSQAMDGDRNHEIFFFFVSQSEHDTTH